MNTVEDTLRKLAEGLVNKLSPTYHWEESHHSEIEHVLSILKNVYSQGEDNGRS